MEKTWYRRVRSQPWENPKYGHASRACTYGDGATHSLMASPPPSPLHFFSKTSLVLFSCKRRYIPFHAHKLTLMSVFREYSFSTKSSVSILDMRSSCVWYTNMSVLYYYCSTSPIFYQYENHIHIIPYCLTSSFHCSSSALSKSAQPLRILRVL